MVHWLDLKKKNSNIDNEKTPCMKKEKFTKFRKYDDW